MPTRAPQSFDRIAKIIGPDAARRLVKYAGGTPRYIPAKAQNGHWLIQAVGAKAADKLCAQLPGETIEVPKIDPIRRNQRNDLIVKRFKNGESTRQLALSLGLSQRGIRWIIQQHGK